MNIKRMQKVVRMLETQVDDEEFDRSIWHCGTRGCTIGWYADYYPRSGFKVSSFGYLESRNGTGFRAIQDYFNINYDLTLDLFGPSNKTRKETINQIKKAIKNEEKLQARLRKDKLSSKIKRGRTTPTLQGSTQQ